jgi:hypothetical protein
MGRATLELARARGHPAPAALAALEAALAADAPADEPAASLPQQLVV